MDETEIPEIDNTLVRRLREIRCRVFAGELSDWERFHHAVSMTCSNFMKERQHPVGYREAELVALLGSINVVLEG